jgi:predicted RNase H-like HicB family nuclease
MKSIIQFSVTKEPEGYYVASGVGHPVFTQAETLDELQKNITEAVELYIQGENLSELGLVDRPALLMNVELPSLQYAKA